MMKMDDFTQGEYVKKEDVMTYLRVFDWNMSREELMERFKEMPAINLTEQDVNKVKINKMFNGEFQAINTQFSKEGSIIWNS